MRKRVQKLFLGISQSIMFSEHEWRDEERRLHKHDRCREDLEADFGSSDDMEFASLDCAELLDPELLVDEYESEPHFVILRERRRIEREEIKAKKTWKHKF